MNYTPQNDCFDTTKGKIISAQVYVIQFFVIFNNKTCKFVKLSKIYIAIISGRMFLPVMRSASEHPTWTSLDTAYFLS